MTTLPPLPASNILIGGRTLLLLPTLVALVGLNEAIVLQQVRYRLGDDLRPQVRDGRRWARDPLDRWRERDFPFWEIDTVRRAFQSLEQRGLLRAEQFDKHLRDRTKWYTPRRMLRYTCLHLAWQERWPRQPVAAPSSTPER